MCSLFLQCSGLGECDETFTCQCVSPVQSGPFAGITMVQGTSCEVVRSKLEMSSWVVRCFTGVILTFRSFDVPLFCFCI